MSSEDVFPPRNLGSAEDWGRKVEGRTREAERYLESLDQRVRQISAQVNSLAGYAVSGLERVPSYVFGSSNERGLGVSVSSQWVTMTRVDLPIPENTSQMIITVTGSLQLQSSTLTAPSPWVKVSGAGWSLPDSQGVRATDTNNGLFLATVGASVLRTPSSQTVSVLLETWTSDSSNFSSPTSTNLASLYVQVAAFPEAVVSGAVE